MYSLHDQMMLYRVVDIGTDIIVCDMRNSLHPRFTIHCCNLNLQILGVSKLWFPCYFYDITS